MKLFISRIVTFTIAFTFIMGGTLQFTSIDFLSPVTAEAKRDKDKDKDKDKGKDKDTDKKRGKSAGKGKGKKKGHNR